MEFLFLVGVSVLLAGLFLFLILGPAFRDDSMMSAGALVTVIGVLMATFAAASPWTKADRVRRANRVIAAATVAAAEGRIEATVVDLEQRASAAQTAVAAAVATQEGGR